MRVLAAPIPRKGLPSNWVRKKGQVIRSRATVQDISVESDSSTGTDHVAFTPSGESHLVREAPRWRPPLQTVPPVCSTGRSRAVPYSSPSLAPLSSSICGKVSAASVASIIGYKVPAGVPFTRSIKPTKENYEISGKETICTYGAQTGMATILKAVTLSFETLSKPLTPSEMQQSIAKASTLAKFKFSTYSGLGVPAFYFSLTESGITGQGITGVLGGTTYFGASVESKKVSKSSLDALAKLAEKL